MDEHKRNLQGSTKRDAFKRRHKSINPRFYAADADFCLISKKPPGVVAYLDYKGLEDNITFSEGILYNAWLKNAPVYIVIGDDPENGPFIIKRLLSVDWRPEPVIPNYDDGLFIANDWDDFEDWENELREEYERRNGWNGSLRVQEVEGLAM